MCFRFIHMRRAWNKFREIEVITDVVNSLVHSSMWQYAVISVRSEPRRDRLVIAYPDEKSLRDLLAAPSILGLGYRSREEAQASIDRYTMTAYSSRPKVTATLVTVTRSFKTLVANHQFPTVWFKLARTWSIIRDVLQHSNVRRLFRGFQRQRQFCVQVARKTQ